MARVRRLVHPEPRARHSPLPPDGGARAPHIAHGEPGYPVTRMLPPAFADPHDGDGSNCGSDPCSTVGLDELVGDDPRAEGPTYLLDQAGDDFSRSRLADQSAPEPDDGPRSARPAQPGCGMVQSVDRMIGRDSGTVGPRHLRRGDLRQRLPPRPAPAQRRRGGADDSDTRVPFIVVGPDVVPGPRSRVVSNVDLAPTFERLAGAPGGRWTGSCRIRVLLGRDPLSSSTCTPFSQMRLGRREGPRRGRPDPLLRRAAQLRGAGRGSLDLSDEGVDMAYDYRGSVRSSAPSRARRPGEPFWVGEAT